jgi:hypothetical protein
MSKVVVKDKGRVFSIERDTPQEKSDNIWLDNYKLLRDFIADFGHQNFPTTEKSPDYRPRYTMLNGWARRQRTSYKKGGLEDWQYEYLVRAGFDFEPNETKWNNKYTELLNYKNIFGHCNVSKSDMIYEKLGNWVATQRQYKEKLPEHRIKKLEDIGFEWGKSFNDWDYNYNWLKEYYEKYGFSYVKRDYSKPYASDRLNTLNRWVGKQIFYYHKGELPEDKIKLLEEVEFDFEHKDTWYNDLWSTNIQKLIDFKAKYGNYQVPHSWEEDVPFSRWVRRQRDDRKKLSKRKIDSLNSISFTWSIYDDIWENNYNDLKKYVKEFGSSKVEKKINEKIYDWTICMRKARRGYFSYTLSEEKIKKLDELEFDWDPKYIFWSSCYQKLAEFKETNGHCNIEMNNETKVLFLWCQSNRENKAKLPGDKIKLLDELGFEW